MGKVLSFLGDNTIVAAVIGGIFTLLVCMATISLGIYQTERPISATKTAESKLTTQALLTIETMFTPTFTPKPASTWTPTLTPKPALTWTPTFTPKPASTHTSTSTPKPTPTHTSTSTPIPTKTPLPTLTTALLGTETIPLTNFASTLPWLPLDESSIPCVEYYSFNVTKPPFDNRLVRQAFASVVNRQAFAGLADNFGKKQPRVATNFTPPQVLGRDLYGEVGLPSDLNTARKLLTQAGFPNGEGLPEVTLTFNRKEEHEATANVMATTWRDQLGANVVLKPVDDWGTYLETLNDAPTIFRLGWCADYIDPDNFLFLFHTTNEDNRTQFANAEFNKLVEQAKTISDPVTRQSLYIQAEQILCEQEAAIIPLYHFINSD